MNAPFAESLSPLGVETGAAEFGRVHSSYGWPPNAASTRSIKRRSLNV
jgi:hypothetical protein